MDRTNSNCENSCIKPINLGTVHRICSGQVVLNLAIAVKELVENAMDAGATNIDIKLKNYGIELIEVSDNGSGVTEDNFSALTLKYHTSKLTDYSDLLGVSSFGFRGEALSSLCALANMTITTRHSSQSYAIKIEYDQNGKIVKKTPCSRQVGTTVSLTNLFHTLPVRLKEFHKNAKREFNKMTQLLYAYCLISVGVKITCSNQTNSNSKSIVVATQGSLSYKDNISCVFGIKQLQSLLEIKPEYVSNIKDNIFKGLSECIETSEIKEEIEDVEINLSEDSNDTDINEAKVDTLTSTQKLQGYKNIVKPVEFTGFISSCAHGQGRSSTDRQFFFVNNRPCEPSKVIKIMNEIYRQYNPSQYPFIFMNINIDRTSVDINVTPDKRKVFLTKEKIVIDCIKHSLLKLFENIPRTLKIETPLSQESNKSLTPQLDQPRIFTSFLQQFGKSNSLSESTKHTLEKTNNELKRKSTTMLDFISSKVKKPSDDEDEPIQEEHDFDTTLETNEVDDGEKNSNNVMDSTHTSSSASLNGEEKSDCVIDNTPTISSILSNENNKLKPVPSTNTEQLTKIEKANIMYLESDNLPATQIRNLSDVVPIESHTIICKTKNMCNNESPMKKAKLNSITNIKCESKKATAKTVTDKEDLGKLHRKTVTMKTSLEHVKTLTNVYHTNRTRVPPTKVKFKSEINPVFNKECEKELSKEISKDSFKQMKIIGQFNLGFIITKLEDDLFIIDQHATDEIYNFETLQKTSELTNQKLVIPQQLELTGVNEQILMDNLDIFKKNGFTFDINENALPTKTVKLLTIPMSKNWIFGKEDIEELLFMLRESPSEYCRPSRVRAMFASRACRKSVMIGTALAKTDMKKLVDHMAEIDKPWNCPHGRPTIRHLVNLAMICTKKNCD